MAEYEDRVTPRIPREELDETDVPELPEHEGIDNEAATEGWNTDESGIVGGESSLPRVEAVESSLGSTTGRVEVEGRSRTGAIGNVGSPRTTRGPEDDVAVEDQDRLEHHGGLTGSVTGADVDEG